MSLNNDSTITETQLILLLKAKNEQALPVLYEKYGMALFGVIYQIIKNQQIAEDILQDVFYKIWVNAAQYNAKKGRLFTWMVRIARNAAIDEKRSKRYKNSLKTYDLYDNQAAVEKNSFIVQNIDMIGVRELIEQLNTKYRVIIELIYFQGYTQVEASQELAIPLGTVKTRVKKAISYLKKWVIHE